MIIIFFNGLAVKQSEQVSVVTSVVIVVKVVAASARWRDQLSSMIALHKLAD